jgi:hypothetical protein
MVLIAFEDAELAALRNEIFIGNGFHWARILAEQADEASE